MSKLEEQISGFKTIQAWKKGASEAELVLDPGKERNSGDLPRSAYSELRKFRRASAMGKEQRKTIKTISRANVTVKDPKGKLARKDVLWYTCDLIVTNNRGVEYHADFTIGKHDVPKIVPNPNLKYDPNTGEPIGADKILSGRETIYEIEVPKTKEARKKLLDSIIEDSDSYPDSVLFYYRKLNDQNYEQIRDASYTYDDFVNYSIDEIKNMNEKTGGSKGSSYYRDADNNLRSIKDNSIVSRGNAGVYR